MKCIFLDFDGVLNTATYQQELLSSNLPQEDDYGRIFSPLAMDSLFRLVRTTGARIVVTSSWKGIYTLEELRQMWTDRGYEGTVDDVTRNGVSDEWLLSADLSALDNFNLPHPKGMEIADYINNNDVEEFVIIDDEPIALKQHRNHLFLVDSEMGLTDAIAEEIALFLNGK